MQQLFPPASPQVDPDLPGLYAYPAGQWLRANMVSSADGAASLGGASRGLSSDTDRQVFALLRALADDENPVRPSPSVSKVTSSALGTARVEQLKREAAGAVAAAEKRLDAFAAVSKAVARLREVTALVQQLDADVAEHTARRDRAEAEVRAEVLRQGKSAGEGPVRAIYYRGRVTWDSKGLAQYAEAHPEVEQFRKVGAPSVAIRYQKP